MGVDETAYKIILGFTKIADDLEHRLSRIGSQNVPILKVKDSYSEPMGNNKYIIGLRITYLYEGEICAEDFYYGYKHTNKWERLVTCLNKK